MTRSFTVGLLLGMFLAALGQALKATPAPSKPTTTTLHNVIVTGSITLTSPDKKRTVYLSATDDWAGIEVKTEAGPIASVVSTGDNAYLMTFGKAYKTPLAFWTDTEGTAWLQCPTTGAARTVDLSEGSKKLE